MRPLTANPSHRYQFIVRTDPHQPGARWIRSTTRAELCPPPLAIFVIEYTMFAAEWNYPPSEATHAQPLHLAGCGNTLVMACSLE